MPFEASEATATELPVYLLDPRLSGRHRRRLDRALTEAIRYLRSAEAIAVGVATRGTADEHVTERLQDALDAALGARLILRVPDLDRDDLYERNP